MVRLWAQNSHSANSEYQPRENENAPGEKRKEGEEGENASEGYRLLIEWDVEICCLRYLGKHVRNHFLFSLFMYCDKWWRFRRHFVFRFCGFGIFYLLWWPVKMPMVPVSKISQILPNLARRHRNFSSGEFTHFRARRWVLYHSRLRGMYF